MTTAQAFTLNTLLRPLFTNEGDTKQLLTVVEDVYDDKVNIIKKEFSTVSELSLVRKDIDGLKREVENLKFEIEKSSLRVENNLKSEINKLIVWIIGIIFTAAAVFFALSKFVSS